MKKVRSVLSIVLMVSMLVLTSFGQAGDNLRLGMDATATVGHGSTATSDVHFRNHVKWEFRHCQKYMHEQGHWFWKKTVIDKEACAADSSTLFNVQENHNVVMNFGFDTIQNQVVGGASGTAASATATCKWLSVSNTDVSAWTAATAPSGYTELTNSDANGIAKAVATYAKTSSTVFTMQKAFSITSGTNVNSRATALHNTVTGGVTNDICFVASYTQVPVSNGDTLTVTWTITLS